MTVQDTAAMQIDNDSESDTQIQPKFTAAEKGKGRAVDPPVMKKAINDNNLPWYS